MKEPLINITPTKFRCDPPQFNCPTLFKNNTNYIIIGKTVTPETHPELNGKIGNNETAIEIPMELFEKSTNIK
jgi:hypothetical protein